MARCYDQQTKQVNDLKSNDYFNVSVEGIAYWVVSEQESWLKQKGAHFIEAFEKGN